MTDFVDLVLKYGPTGVLAVMVFLMMKAQLVPKETVERLIKQYEDRLEEASKWREEQLMATAKQYEEQLVDRTKQRDRLLDLALKSTELSGIAARKLPDQHEHERDKER